MLVVPIAVFFGVQKYLAGQAAIGIVWDMPEVISAGAAVVAANAIIALYVIVALLESNDLPATARPKQQ